MPDLIHWAPDGFREAVACGLDPDQGEVYARDMTEHPEAVTCPTCRAIVEEES